LEKLDFHQEMIKFPFLIDSKILKFVTILRNNQFFL
jgi:hypothetical protein